MTWLMVEQTQQRGTSYLTFMSSLTGTLGLFCGTGCGTDSGPAFAFGFLLFSHTEPDCLFVAVYLLFRRSRAEGKCGSGPRRRCRLILKNS